MKRCLLISNLLLATVAHCVYAGDATSAKASSMAQLRLELTRAEDDVHRIFNALTDKEDLRIKCTTRRRSGSSIPKRTCEPQFMLSARAKGIADRLEENNVKDDQQIQRLMAPKFRELEIEMDRLAASNPEFRDAMVKHAKLKQEYTAQTAND